MKTNKNRENLLKFIQENDISGMSLREVGRRCGIGPSAGVVAHHLKKINEMIKYSEMFDEKRIEIHIKNDYRYKRGFEDGEREMKKKILSILKQWLIIKDINTWKQKI